MDTELRSLEIKAINDPSQIPRLIQVQKRAGKMLFKNSEGLELLNQCTGTHSKKFEIQSSTRVQYFLRFPALDDKSKSLTAYILLDVTYDKKEGGKDVITLSLQVSNNAILLEKVYIDDPGSIEKMTERVSNLVTALANGKPYEQKDQ